jgi:hypothetical protein
MSYKVYRERIFKNSTAVFSRQAVVLRESRLHARFDQTRLNRVAGEALIDVDDNQVTWERGVGGASPMCAMPFPRSTLSTVVGFVLAAKLRKARGTNRYNDEECEGGGEGGALGGIGQRDAFSSTSMATDGDHMDSGPKDDLRCEVGALLTQLLDDHFQALESGKSGAQFL